MKETARQIRPGRAADPAGGSGRPSPELQQLWFATQRRKWSSLAIVPAHPGISAAPLARALSEVAKLYRDGPVKLVIAEGGDFPPPVSFVNEMKANAANGTLVIVALESVLSNQAGIPVAQSADAALLCVRLGETDADSARRTLDLIGHDRFVGCVALQR